MSVSVQQQPIGLDAFGQSGLQGLQGVSSQSPQGASEIQARLTEAILQILNLLINEIMKALQQAQQAQQAQQGGQGSPSSSGGGGSGGGGGGGGPSGVGGPQGVSNAYKPTHEAQGPSGYSSPAASANSPTPAVGDVSSTSGGKGPAGMPAELWQGCQDAAKKTGVDPYLLAAQMEKESQFGKGLSGSPSAGDGLMQVEPGTRQAYAGKFQEKMGHAYDHGDPKDQIAMAGVILADKGGDATNMLQKYNGGDNWAPGATDSYGREIKAAEYAASVQARAQQMKAGG
ncbi:transglycosylase SLT domain-containing protein [Roseateles amylovorans]|uniref:Transglycosylase SLT domain-containing protein n=1 Tax=Roseateles amylovorans TaxID=2978473 RepID=A0ABY6BB74_9BURK|nr:transglycosylase SLT domain-containing protein [Roseateles amylovorans]UXH80452.1 transglycosylase SLT domain-containing protein [Roseateles amylovorans]